MESASAAAGGTAERVAKAVTPTPADGAGELHLESLQSPELPHKQQQQQQQKQEQAQSQPKQQQVKEPIEGTLQQLPFAAEDGGLKDFSSLLAFSRRVGAAFAADEPSTAATGPAAVKSSAAPEENLAAAVRSSPAAADLADLAALMPGKSPPVAAEGTTAVRTLGMGGADDEFLAMIAALQQATAGTAAAAPTSPAAAGAAGAAVGLSADLSFGAVSAATDGNEGLSVGGPVVAVGTAAVVKTRKKRPGSSSAVHAAQLAAAPASAAGVGGKADAPSGFGHGYGSHELKARTYGEENGQRGGCISRLGEGPAAKHKKRKVDTAKQAGGDSIEAVDNAAADVHGLGSSLEQAAADALAAAKKSKVKAVRKSRTGAAAAAAASEAVATEADRPSELGSVLAAQGGGVASVAGDGQNVDAGTLAEVPAAGKVKKNGRVRAPRKLKAEAAADRDKLSGGSGTVAGQSTAPVVAAAAGSEGGSGAFAAAAAEVADGGGVVEGTTASDDGTASGGIVASGKKKRDKKEKLPPREKKEQPPPKPKRVTKKDIALQVQAEARQGVFTERSSLAESYSHIGMFTGRTVSGAWEALLASAKEQEVQAPIVGQEEKGMDALDQLLPRSLPSFKGPSQQQQQEDRVGEQEQHQEQDQKGEGGVLQKDRLRGKQQQQQDEEMQEQQQQIREGQKKQRYGKREGLSAPAKGVQKVATKQVLAEDQHTCSEADTRLLHQQLHGKLSAAPAGDLDGNDDHGDDEVRRLALAGSGASAAPAVVGLGVGLGAGGGVPDAGGGDSGVVTRRDGEVLQVLNPEQLRSPVAKAQLAVQGLVQAQQLEQLGLSTPPLAQQQQQYLEEGPSTTTPAAAAAGGAGIGEDVASGSQQDKLRELRRQASRGRQPQHLMLLEHSSQGAVTAVSLEAPVGVTQVTSSDTEGLEAGEEAVAVAGGSGDGVAAKQALDAAVNTLVAPQGDLVNLSAAVSPEELRVLPNLGYACLNMTMREYDIFNSRDCVKKTFTASNGLEVTSQLALANARDLVPLIR
jgi:hypothetical protein